MIATDHMRNHVLVTLYFRPLKKGDVVYEVGGGGCEGCSTGVCDPVSKLCEMADYPKGNFMQVRIQIQCT
ncbi:unnamed protein product [Cylicostephanus goldi]|uniref:Uncharacterized protein n=1 Tax=Cylicostephanus goldi TaxID=71465 RepID=A0A3P7P1A2_CYLGO|nr:unnamed protein product [Cylicostephanus goldi]